MTNGRMGTVTFPVPISPDRWGSMTLPHPLTPAEWEQLLATLAAFRPGLVCDATSDDDGGDDARG